MKTKHKLKGIFKLEKVPTHVRAEMIKRAVGDYEGKLEPEDINFIDDLLYLAWLYAHGLLIFEKYELEGEMESLDAQGEKTMISLNGKSFVQSFASNDRIFHYFNEESTIYPDGVLSDFSDMYTAYGLKDFKDALLKIEPEKITKEDILKSINNYALLALIKHYNTIYECHILGTKETVVICIAWLYHHGLLINYHAARIHVNEELVDIDLNENRACSAFEELLFKDLDRINFQAYYDLDKIVKIAGWDKKDKEYYLRRHLVKEEH